LFCFFNGDDDWGGGKLLGLLGSSPLFPFCILKKKT
jgi:hypothetical protein